MTLRFQADVNLNQSILRAACRREPALDVQTAEPVLKESESRRG
jgi:hypothetical protein